MKQFIVALFLLPLSQIVTGQKKLTEQGHHDSYLFVYFTGNSQNQEQIHFALSYNGLHFTALNNNEPIMASAEINETGGIRDPHILRGEDGKTFYMVATDMVSANGWNSNRGMVLLKSTDLMHWSSAIVNIEKKYPEKKHLKRVWAPQTIYDKKAGKYLIYFSLKYNEEEDKIYYAYANKDFTDIEGKPKQLFFNPDGKACIDGDIVQKGKQFHLFYKTEGAEKGIHKAVSRKLTAKYKTVPGALQLTTSPVEGAGIFKLNNDSGYILMYDMYMSGKYQFTFSKDLKHFEVIDEKVSMNFHPRHGTVIPISATEAARLVARWPSGKKDTIATFPIKDSTSHNPVLKGLYADPEILYCKKNGRFYIYPTSDGFNNWSGDYFKAFSSEDLIHWKDEGKILQLGTDVQWATKNAWAPCIVEKEINGRYKYFYYFTAAGKIGVASSDEPNGPFTDLGKPLIDELPKDVKNGQQIDPDVFIDPATGKSYIYWGNSYMAGAELGDDMISLKAGTVQILTPDATFREGTYVFYRNGKYYFMWSENDTRDADYRVRYGIADAPLAKITIPKDNLVLMKDTTSGIYGTGHNAVVQDPTSDTWYIVYHRFQYPNGIKMGKAAGYNREICIDVLSFREDGSIERVKPTHAGVSRKQTF